MKPDNIPALLWLVERVASFLDRKDLLACMLVNKLFNQAFSRIFWDRLVLPPKDPSTKTKVIAQALSKYGHLVHELVLIDEATERFYTLSASKCNSLTSVIMAPNDANLWPSIVKLLQSNPTIAALDYEERAPVLNGHTVDELVKNLSQLQVLKINLAVYLAWTDLMNLGLSCRKLCTLVNDTVINPATCNVIEDPLERISEITPEDVSATRFRSLDTLRLSCAQDDKVLAMLLGHCPCLKTLDFVLSSSMALTAKSLGADRCCPDLEVIVIKQDLNVKTERPLADIVQSLPPGHFKRLEVHNGFAGMRTLKSIAEQQASSLKILHLIDVERVDGKSLGYVLCQCHLLEEIKISLLPTSRSAPEVIHCLHLLQTPWVCLNLQRLCAPIGWPLTLSVTELDIELMKNTPLFCHTERAFYTQLGKLKNLRELRLLCHDVYCDQRSAIVRASGFTWTLARGLRQMRTLRKLEVFDIGNFSHEMSTTELEWINSHWKQLKVFRAHRPTLEFTNPNTLYLDVMLQLLAIHGTITLESDSTSDDYIDDVDDDDGDSGMWETDSDAYSSH
ncbi:hypothetical protein BGW42_007892 [Actinomortierella wolfii]|nr:hypothetical protein BGW42_007892 [Actinomortierella wolfii]